MELTKVVAIVIRVVVGILGFYWDNGKEHGNYYNGVYIRVINNNRSSHSYKNSSSDSKHNNIRKLVVIIVVTLRRRISVKRGIPLQIPNPKP